MISPKYSLSHYFFNDSRPRTKAPNVVNLYLDYNCPFSAKIFFKFLEIIPLLEKRYPGTFQFVFVNVVQPWHPNSVLLNEFSLVVADLLRKDDPNISNEMFWIVSGSLFRNKEKFYDSATVSLGRNETYKHIYDVVQEEVELLFDQNDILDKLYIKEETDTAKASNGGNFATVDIKYFTRYLRTVGVHVTPTVSVNGIVNDSISSGSSNEELLKIFETYL
ncbi:hypothetical protein JCM33374_g5969 [Metschnikowia sp. JCM 33374]|nr:hypothetical protein JCM33374_g5969 [Metschnikowia sp. JCM 33374]